MIKLKAYLMFLDQQKQLTNTMKLSASKNIQINESEILSLLLLDSSFDSFVLLLKLMIPYHKDPKYAYLFIFLLFHLFFYYFIILSFSFYCFVISFILFIYLLDLHNNLPFHFFTGITLTYASTLHTHVPYEVILSLFLFKKFFLFYFLLFSLLPIPIPFTPFVFLLF